MTLVCTGDGGTSKADFHEALNFAGVYDLPVVFCVENNQWAISVRRDKQTASKTIAQKAVAYGFEGILVDGNDVIASYEATKYAVEKARRGGGPTLLEFSTYRLGPHTTAELVSNKLKAPEEIAEWEKQEPDHAGSRSISGRAGSSTTESKECGRREAQEEDGRGCHGLPDSDSASDPSRHVRLHVLSPRRRRWLEEKAEAFGVSPGQPRAARQSRP